MSHETCVSAVVSSVSQSHSMTSPIQLPPDWGSRTRLLRAGFKCCHEQGLLTIANLAREDHPLSELTAYQDNVYHTVDAL